MTVWAVVVAAGGGARFGGPKQFEVVAGRRVLDWSVEAAARTCDRVVLVAPADRVDELVGSTAADVVVPGAATRSGSVRAGLAVAATSGADADIVVVHDAARPLASDALFRAVVAAVAAGAAGAVPGLPIADTVKQVAGDEVVATLDRATLVAVQTPQAFRAESLRRAHLGAPEATDDAALVEAAGGRVVVVPGEIGNRKITVPDDLASAAAVLA